MLVTSKPDVIAPTPSPPGPLLLSHNLQATASPAWGPRLQALAVYSSKNEIFENFFLTW